MRVRSLRIFVSILFAAALGSTLSATHSWGGYHWARTANPFTLKLGNNMTGPNWPGHLTTTSQAWNSGNTPLITAVVNGTSPNVKRCAMVPGTTQVCNGKYGNNGWLGLATISISGGTHITQGSAKMNDTYFSLTKYNNPNERLHVVCQEVAHTFGLDHQSEDGSSLDTCMDYFSNTGVNATSSASTAPNQHDFDELKTIYAHLDNTTTVAAQTALQPSRSDVDDDDPNAWGRLVSQSGNGRSSTYERAERGGGKTVTHVFWSEEAAEQCPSCDHRYDH